VRDRKGEELGEEGDGERGRLDTHEALGSSASCVD
jgi:hypothetical protein